MLVLLRNMNFVIVIFFIIPCYNADQFYTDLNPDPIPMSWNRRQYNSAANIGPHNFATFGNQMPMLRPNSMGSPNAMGTANSMRTGYMGQTGQLGQMSQMGRMGQMEQAPMGQMGHIAQMEQGQMSQMGEIGQPEQMGNPRQLQQMGYDSLNNVGSQGNINQPYGGMDQSITANNRYPGPIRSNNYPAYNPSSGFQNRYGSMGQYQQYQGLRNSPPGYGYPPASYSHVPSMNLNFRHNAIQSHMPHRKETNEQNRPISPNGDLNLHKSVNHTGVFGLNGRTDPDQSLEIADKTRNVELKLTNEQDPMAKIKNPVNEMKSKGLLPHDLSEVNSTIIQKPYDMWKNITDEIKKVAAAKAKKNNQVLGNPGSFPQRQIAIKPDELMASQQGFESGVDRNMGLPGNMPQMGRNMEWQGNMMQNGIPMAEQYGSNAVNAMNGQEDIMSQYPSGQPYFDNNVDGDINSLGPQNKFPVPQNMGPQFLRQSHTNPQYSPEGFQMGMNPMGPLISGKENTESDGPKDTAVQNKHENPEELTEDDATIPDNKATMPPLQTTEISKVTIPTRDDFGVPIKWVDINSKDTEDGLAQVTDPKTNSNYQYEEHGIVYVPVVNHDADNAVLTTARSMDAKKDPNTTPTQQVAALRNVLQSVDLKDIDETDWLVVETGLGGKNEKNKCTGEACQSRCYRAECDSFCDGETCASGCVGDACIGICHGPGCNAMCVGNKCVAKCKGPNCEAKCRGDSCDSQCRGPSCLNVINGKTKTGGSWSEGPEDDGERLSFNNNAAGNVLKPNDNMAYY